MVSWLHDLAPPLPPTSQLPGSLGSLAPCPQHPFTPACLPSLMTLMQPLDFLCCNSVRSYSTWSALLFYYTQNCSSVEASGSDTPVPSHHLSSFRPQSLSEISVTWPFLPSQSWSLSRLHSLPTPLYRTPRGFLLTTSWIPFHSQSSVSSIPFIGGRKWNNLG